MNIWTTSMLGMVYSSVNTNATRGPKISIRGALIIRLP